MDFDLTEEHQLLQQTVRDYVRDHVAPVAAKLDETESFPEGPVKAAAELSLLTITIPEAFGGTAIGNLAASIVVEEVSRVCPSTGVTLSVHNSLVCTPIAKWGSDSIKQRYLPRLATSKLLNAYCLSEAEAGTDTTNQQTRAIKQNDR